MISTLHDKAEIPKQNNPKKKPSTILTYNQTKCGVDSVDQMTRQYSVKAPTRKWPMQVWSNILNLIGINSWILYKNVNKTTKITRRRFLIKLIEEIASMTSENNDVSDDVSNNNIQTKRKIKFTHNKKSCKIKKCNNNKALGVCQTCQLDVCGKCSAEYEYKITCRNCFEH